MSDIDLNDRAWNALLASLKGFDHKIAKVGLLASKGGADEDENGFTLAARGAVHEFGSDDGVNPERRWLRGTFETYQSELEEMQTKVAKAFFRGGLTPDRALGLLGTWGSNKVKYHVKNDDISPPSKKLGKDDGGRTLIDTALMVNSVNYAVVDARENADESLTATSIGT